ncbi:MAG TPA: ATP-binding protein [Planctomycetaceae bacterium]|nr:ATP-binding protein [Planctomycetaceae bacterium]
MSSPIPSPQNDTARLQRQFEEISILAGGLAHEIRNPLSTISMNLELIAEEVEDEGTPASRRLLQRIATIQQECGQLEAILNDFLQYARVGQIDAEPADLNEIVTSFIDFYRTQANEHRVEISPHLGSDLPNVEVDRSLLRQVLMNLGRNSLEAMPAGGVIELQTRREDDRVLLEFIDNGEGMDEKTRDRIFEAFFSRKQGGSGLGLATVRKIVEAHRGQIHCESEPGQGTRMTILLPLRNL